MKQLLAAYKNERLRKTTKGKIKKWKNKQKQMSIFKKNTKRKKNDLKHSFPSECFATLVRKISNPTHSAFGSFISFDYCHIIRAKGRRKELLHRTAETKRRPLIPFISEP